MANSGPAAVTQVTVAGSLQSVTRAMRLLELVAAHRDGVMAEVNPSDLEQLIDVLNDDVAAHTGGRAVDDTTVMACRLTAPA